MTTEPLLARITPRLRAAVLDALVLIGFIVLMVLLESFVRGVAGGRAYGLFFVLAVLLYEPVAVAAFGGTVGHRLQNLRVVRTEPDEAVGFPRALLRWAIKGVLGGVSFLAMAFRGKPRTFHDIATGCMVVARDPSRASSWHFVGSGEDGGPVEGQHAKPTTSALRRVVVTAGYLLLTTLAYIVLLLVFTSQPCLEVDRCTPTETAIGEGLSLMWLVLLVGLAITGWKGRLRGARNRPAPEDPPND